MYRIRTALTGITGAPYVSTLYFIESGGTAQQAATAVGTFWGALDNYMNSGISWDVEDVVALVDEANGQTTGIVSVTGGTGAGAVASDPVPFACQALIRWRTGVFSSGREIRGRTFVPGITEGQSNGALSATVQTAFNTAGNALIADATCELGVFSPTHHLVEAVSAADTWNQFAVLTSRRD